MAEYARPETYREKMMRKLKTEPLVPVGALATTAALTIAMVKLRKGDSRSLNKWLRVRVVAQGLTIAAICAGSFTFATHKPPTPAELAAKAEERHQNERAEFEERLHAAEEAEAVEAAFRAPAQISASTPASGKTVLKRKTFADKATPAPSEVPASSQETPSTAASAIAGENSSKSWFSSWFGSGSGK